MGVPKGRRTKSKQGHRRSHLGLKPIKLTTCSHCGVTKLPHYVCTNCGFYNGRPVIDVLKKLSKQDRKAKEKELAKEAETQPAAQKDLSPEGLSQQRN